MQKTERPDFIYNEAEGRCLGIYPVSLFKIVMIQYIFRIRNMHQSIKAIESNYAQLWSISYDIGEDIPHFSTLEKHYCRLFKDTDYLHEF